VVEPLPLTGGLTNHVYFEGASEGVAGDDDGDGLDEVATEVVALHLTGVSSTYGPVQVGLRPGTVSTGQIEETANSQSGTLDVPPFAAAGTAFMHHEVQVQVTVAGQTLYGTVPMTLWRVIAHKPPAPGPYTVVPREIPLWIGRGTPTGYVLVLGPRDRTVAAQRPPLPVTGGPSGLRTGGPGHAVEDLVAFAGRDLVVDRRVEDVLLLEVVRLQDRQQPRVVVIGRAVAFVQPFPDDVEAVLDLPVFGAHHGGRAGVAHARVGLEHGKEDVFLPRDVALQSRSELVERRARGERLVRLQ
jgi:hypothetical protein